MKFLLIAGFPDSVIVFRAALILDLISRGWEVHVAVPDAPSGSSMCSTLESMGVVVHNIPLKRTGMNPFSDVYLLWVLCCVIARIRPAAVLAYTIKSVIYGLIASWFMRVPKRFALITGLGYAFQTQGRGALRSLASVLYAASLARVTCVFFQNPDDRQLFIQRGIVRPGVRSIVVNGSGVDLSVFKQRSLPLGPLKFILIARLLGSKGVREYAFAARRIKSMYPEVQFMLVGWIDSNPDAISTAELDEWITDGALVYLGRLADVRSALADSSIYVLPSYREGTPRTVLEAMAIGRPIITTDAPGCRETVIEGENGFLVPVASVDALERAMLKFIRCPEIIERMSNRSRQIAEEKYDVNKVNAMMFEEMRV